MSGRKLSWSYWFTRRKTNEFDALEFERQRADNPLIKQLREDQAKYQRTIRENEIIVNMSLACGKLVSKYNKDIPHEDYAYFMLYEGFTAFLPIAIKPFLQPWDVIYIHVANPLKDAKITYIE